MIQGSGPGCHSASFAARANNARSASALKSKKRVSLSNSGAKRSWLWLTVAKSRARPCARLVRSGSASRKSRVNNSANCWRSASLLACSVANSGNSAVGVNGFIGAPRLIGERLSQGAQRRGDTRFDGANQDAQSRGDLARGEPLEIAEEEHLALIIVERREQLPKACHPAPLRRAFGIGESGPTNPHRPWAPCGRRRLTCESRSRGCACAVRAAALTLPRFRS